MLYVVFCCCSLCSWWNNLSVLCQGWPKLSCTMPKPVFQLGLKPRGVCCSSEMPLRNRRFWLRQHILTFQAQHNTKKYLQQSCASATDEHQPRVWSITNAAFTSSCLRLLFSCSGGDLKVKWLWKSGNQNRSHHRSVKQTAEQQWALGFSVAFPQVFRTLSREAASHLNRDFNFFGALCKQEFPEECSLYIAYRRSNGGERCNWLCRKCQPGVKMPHYSAATILSRIIHVPFLPSTQVFWHLLLWYVNQLSIISFVAYLQLSF